MNCNRRPVMKLGVVDFGVETARLPNGLTLDLAVVRHPGASAVVALDDHGWVVMLRQYRYAVEDYLWEIPAGCRNGDESPRECAARELREEAGLSASRLDYLGSIVTIPSFCNERIELFLARGLAPAPTNPDPDEVIGVNRFAFGETLAMIRRGEIIDAKTIAGLWQAHAFLELEPEARESKVKS